MHFLNRERRRGRGRGQSLAEFALTLPILLLILLFALDLGRVFLGWVTLNNAARIAANYAASGNPPLTAAQLTQYRAIVAKETAGTNCDPAPIADPTFPGVTGTIVGGRAVVVLHCSFPLLTPFIGALFPGGVVQVNASADFPIRAGILANVVPGQTIAPLSAPDQDFSIVPNSGFSPLTVNFVLGPQNGGPAQTWLWNFGDSTTDPVNPVPAAHTYGGNTTFTVTLTETNGAGQSVYSHTVTTNGPAPAPVAGFYGTVPAPCMTVGGPNGENCGGSTGDSIFYTWPMTVAFTDTSLNNVGATYSWDFGDGSAFGTTASPSHTYSAPGIFDVIQTVTTASGTNSLTLNAYVNAGCVIPTFVGTSSNSATATWTAAHFLSSNLYFYKKQGNSFVYATGAPPPGQAYTIQLQAPQGGLFDTPALVGGTYQCGATMRVAPSGANPVP